jgi:hypothetical protein
LGFQTLVIIDESQDLEKQYFDAFWKMLTIENFDVFLIGDELQSILSSENVFTHLKTNRNLYSNIIYDPNSSVNRVERFHNTIFKTFVNGIVNFEWYNLPKIIDICPRESSCGHTHKSNYDAVKMFQIPIIYASDYDDDKVSRCVDQIVGYFNNEINENFYGPQDFMIIFPILSNNLLSTRLSEKLQEFWDEKMKDKKYLKIIEKDKNWNDKNNKKKKFVFLHRSENNQPIDLEESKFSTQILSIHSAKGNGRKCVFALGLNDYALKIYSTNISDKYKPNIIYDSLIHVALTRQKEKLYIGLVNDNGDIWNKFNEMKKINSQWIINSDKTIKPPKIESYKIKFDSIIEYVIKNQESYDKIYNIIKQDKMFDCFKFDDKDNILIGMEYHIVRQKVFEYNFLHKIYSNEKSDSNEQFIKQLDNLSKKNIEQMIHNDYFKYLYKIGEDSKDGKYEKIKTIPILKYVKVNKNNYGKYADILNEYIKNIQNKIKISLVAKFCPLECVIYSYMCEIINNNIFAEINITDIYTIFYYYDELYCKGLDKNHVDEYCCKCGECFIKPQVITNNVLSDKASKIEKVIVEYYDTLEKINNLHEKYVKKIVEYINEPIKLYNTKKSFSLIKSKYFNIHKIFRFIGLSDNYIIYFVLKQSINQFNLNEMLINIILDNFFLGNFDKNEHNEQFFNKKIITCIISLDCEEPIFFNFDNEKYFDLIIKFLKKYLIHKYCQINKQIIDEYLYIINNNNEKKIEDDFKKFRRNFEDKKNISQYVLNN